MLACDRSVIRVDCLTPRESSETTDSQKQDEILRHTAIESWSIADRELSKMLQRHSLRGGFQMQYGVAGCSWWVGPQVWGIKPIVGVVRSGFCDKPLVTRGEPLRSDAMD
jgi:hypothetical protein